MDISGFIRKLCVTCLFCMAGLEIDLEVLRKNLVAIILFTILPYACEAIATMFTCKLFLGYSLMFGLTVGFIMAAVCPAVVVPAILNLNSQNLAKRNGVSTLIFGAASIDDILAITLVTINTSLIFVSDSKDHGTIFDPFIPKEHSSWMFILIEVLISLIPGISLGFLNGY